MTTLFLSGMGFDVHPIQKRTDSSIVLCGIAIPDYAISAHSDGDVALHALADAMLGAIGAGDIGEHFPATKEWENAPSRLFIENILSLYQTEGAELVNVDVTIVCELPKISPYKIAMKSTLIELTDLPASRVNIKATTTDKLGFLGRGEGIAAYATVSVRIQND